MAMNENSKKIFEYVKAHQDENITLNDIAGGTGLAPRSVNGSIVAFQRKTVEIDGEKIPTPLMERIEAEVEVKDEKGAVKHQTVKFIRLTEAGMNYVEE